MGWLSGWSYAKEISLTGQTGAGTLYQVDLDIGASAGGDFHLEGHCTNFPQDIEVTDNDGTTLLDFLIEDITADPLKLWVEVADDLGSNQSIWIYYGKSGHSTNSNGPATFLQYHGAASSSFLDALVIPATNIVYEVKARQNSDANLKYGVANTANRTDDEMSIATSPQSTDRRYHACKNEGNISYTEEAPNFVTSQWYHGLCYNTGSISRGYWDDNEIGAGGISTNLPNENMGLWFSVDAGTGEQEWSFARKYNSPEPAFASAGAEQSAPSIGAIMNQFQKANMGADLYNGAIIA